MKSAGEDSQAGHRRLFENMMLGAFRQRADGAFVDVNAAALEIFGLTRDEFLGRTLETPAWDIIREDGSPLPATDHPSTVALRTGNPVLGAVVGVCNERTRDRLWLEINAIPEFHPGARRPHEATVTMHDITGRKQAEANLLFKENIIHSSSSAIATCDLDGNMTYGNPAFLKTWGFDDPEEFLGRPFGEYWLVKDRLNEIMQALRNHGAWFGEIKAKRKDGTIFDVRVSAAIVLDGRGKPIALTSTSADVTQSKQSQERLKQSEIDYRTLAENLTGIVYRVFIREGNRMRFFNSALESLTGFRPEELAEGKVCSIDPLILEEDRKGVLEKIKNAVLTRQSFRIEYRLRCKNGEIRHFSERGKPVCGGDGLPVYIDGVIFDVTEQKRREKALHQSEDRFRAFVTASSDAVYRMNPDWSELHSLKSLESIADPGNSGGTWLEKYVHPDDRSIALPFINEAIRTKSIFELEHRVLRSDGGLGWIFSRVVPLLNAKGEIIEWFGSASDITERKRAEDELRRSRNRLELRVQERTKELSETVQSLHEQGEQLRRLAVQLNSAEQRERQRLAEILHDHIQQLIVAAQLQINWIAHSSNNDAEQLQEGLKEATSILDEALEASRSLAIELCPPVLEKVGLIAALGWLASRMKDRNRFTVNLSTDRRAEPAEKEMRFLLFECARELILNAIKHANVQEADIELTRTRDDQIKMIVRDKGEGFDTAVLGERTAETSSFGLFSIQQRLAHVGGRVKIAAALGKGTEVTLTLPVDSAGSASEALPQILKKETSGTIERSLLHRVLVVDDHSIIREGLKRIFKNMSDIEIVGEAADGPEAIELAETLSPTVVLMDVSLGKMNGMEATRRILEKNPRIKVVSLSMYEGEELAEAMHKAGAVACLTKNVSPNALIEIIRNVGREVVP